MKKNKNEYIIAVDMDDTIENLLEPWVAWLNKKYKLNVSSKNITKWEISGFFPSLTLEQIYEPLHTDSFWSEVKPKKDAAKYLKMLREEGFRVFICTHSDYRTLKAKMDNVLFTYFPFLTWNDVIILHEKQLVHCDILIDDGPHNLEGGQYHKVLFDSPTNRQYVNPEFIRALSWKEIYKIVHVLYNYDNLR